MREWKKIECPMPELTDQKIADLMNIKSSETAIHATAKINPEDYLEQNDKTNN